MSTPINLAQYRQAKQQAQRVQAILDDLVRQDKELTAAQAEALFGTDFAPDHGQGQF